MEVGTHVLLHLTNLHLTSAAAVSPADLSPGRQPRNIRVVFSDQLQQQQQPPPSYPVASAAAVPVAFQPRTLGPATQYAADILDQLPDSALQVTGNPIHPYVL